MKRGFRQAWINGWKAQLQLESGGTIPQPLVVASKAFLAGVMAALEFLAEDDDPPDREERNKAIYRAGEHFSRYLAVQVMTYLKADCNHHARDYVQGDRHKTVSWVMGAMASQLHRQLDDVPEDRYLLPVVVAVLLVAGKGAQS